MEVLRIIFETIVFIAICGAGTLFIIFSLVLTDRSGEVEELEKGDSDMENIYKEQLKRIKKYIENKTLKSFEVDFGLSENRSDRLMTETVTELQIIASMIDEVMTYEDYEEGTFE